MADTAPVGDATGVALPVDAAALAEAGADWLTRAARAFGTLPAGGRAAAIRAITPFSGGNSGSKALLSVEWEGAGDLPGELFVKFSRDLHDPFRDRRKLELEAEVRLAALSRHPAFPVAVPQAIFADFHHASGAGVLITARIPFAEQGIAPLRPKCMDHLLPDAPAHYDAILDALAALAGSWQAGRLEPEGTRLFPWSRAAAMAELPIADGLARLPGQIAALEEFARTCPRLLPAGVVTPGFLARLREEGGRFLAHEADIRAFLLSDPDLLALIHWNGHLDNAWFWHDPAGQLRCGLMDWGMVRVMNMGLALWGALSGAEGAFLVDRLDACLARFAAALAAQGGARIDPARLACHFDMALLLLGFSMMMDAPALIRARLPDAAAATGPRDPMLLADPVAHGFLHVFANFLHVWSTRAIAASLDRALERFPI